MPTQPKALSPRGLRRLSSLAAALLALTALLALAAAALAAKPKKGTQFIGKTSAPAIGGFRAPVSFRVSGNGGSLLGFRYSALGCFGGTPIVLPHEDPYVIGEARRTVGLVRLGRGVYTARRSSSASSLGFTTITTSTVVVRFPRPRHATGRITYRQKLIAHTTAGVLSRSCGPVSVTFTAAAR